MTMNSFINKSTCDCCDEVTYHIPLPLDAVTFEDQEFVLHLTETELQALHLEIREHALQLVDC